MRILFIMRYPLNDDYHLKTKFNGQMQAFVDMGYDVDHLAYDDKYVYLVKFGSDKKEILGKTHFRKLKRYRSTFGLYDLFHYLCKKVSCGKYDYVYMRNKPINSAGLKTFKKLKSNGCKIIVEIPSYGSTEKTPSSMISFFSKVMNHWGKKLPKLVDLYALIGLDGDGEYCGRPAINIKNGISITQVPPKNNRPFGEEIHILALATMRIWHAYDRLIEGMATYNGKYNFILELVGKDADGSLRDWVELAKTRGIEDKVISHGALFGDALTEIFDKCDIAVATLGFHRNGLSCGSTLKIREYTARGIPFIYGYRDESLTGDEYFTLRVPASDEPINFEEVEQWIDGMSKELDLVENMRKYAQENMSWETEFRKLLSFFDKSI